MKKLINSSKNLISKMDKPLLILSILLFIFGLLNIVTASSREAVVRYKVNTYYYFFRQLKMLGVASILSIILLNLRTREYKKLIPVAYGIILIFVLAIFPFGDEINGAKNWLPLPILGNIQPSEFAKPIIIIFVAVLFEKYNKILQSKDNKRYNIIGLILFVGLIIPLLTAAQKDLGGMLIMGTSFMVMFIFSNIKRQDKFRVISLLVAVGIVGMAGITLIKGTLLTDAQMDRFNFFNPCSRYETNGYQTCNAFIALNNGGLTGLGIGKSKQKYSYIPEPHTDSIFAIIGEEYGTLRCTFVFLAYILVLLRILKISANTKSIKGKYICLGIATYIFIHLFLNLGGLFGIIPLTGVPLPFLSYGGSYAISLMCSLAVVQRICIETKEEKLKQSH